MQIKFTDCVDVVGSSCHKFDATKVYVSTGAVDIDHINYSNTEIVDYLNRPSRANLVANKNDILFAKMQATEKTLRINEALSEHIYSTGFCAVRAKNNIISNKCLYYLLTSENFLKQKDKNCSGATQKAITNAGLEKIIVSVPELEYQDAFVEQIEKICSLIEFRKQQLSKLDELVKARFIEMFGSVYEEKFKMKSLPEMVIRDKSSIKRGPFGGALKKEDFVESGYLVYEQRHAIHDDFEYEKYYITKEKYEEMIGFKVVPGDLIISCSGVTLGRIAEVPKGAKEGIINQALLKLSLNQSIMNNTFFIHQFRGEEIQSILFGFSRGSGIPNMPSMNEVKSVKFICPPIELQNEFADFIKQVDKSKLSIQQSLEKLETLKKSLMQQYFG